jgi:cobalamin synthase
MPATTRLFGLALIALGAISYVLTGRTSVTALIPAFVGAAFLVLALIARKESARRHAMHAAVALGLVGAVAALWRAVPAALNGQVARPAVVAQVLMGALLIWYVGLGVRSFIAARLARK